MVIAMCRLFSIFRTKSSRKFRPLSQSDEKISANFVQKARLTAAESFGML